METYIPSLLFIVSAIICRIGIAEKYSNNSDIFYYYDYDELKYKNNF